MFLVAGNSPTRIEDDTSSTKANYGASADPTPRSDSIDIQRASSSSVPQSTNDAEPDVDDEPESEASEDSELDEADNDIELPSVNKIESKQSIVVLERYVLCAMMATKYWEIGLKRHLLQLLNMDSSHQRYILMVSW